MDKICLVATVKAPLDETLMFVNYHLNLGIDDLIIFFDDPNDAAIAALAGTSRVTAIACTPQHWEAVNIRPGAAIEDRQIANANMALAMARKRGAAWIIHIDNDELIFPDGDLKAILSAAGPDVVAFELFEAVPEQLRYAEPFSATLFRKNVRRRRERLAKLMGIREAFFEGGRYLRGHIASKRAVRVTGNVASLGIHRPIAAGPALGDRALPALRLLHFDCIGLELWERKCRRRLDGTATAANLDPPRQRQLDLFAAAADEDARIALYKKLYFIPPREQGLLGRLGMLARFSLDRRMFQAAKG